MPAPSEATPQATDPKRGRRRAIFVLVPALAVAGLGLGALYGQEEVPLPSARVERGDVRITLTESGELRAAQQTTVSASNDKLITWLVAEGAQVKKGDLLIRFESQKYELARSTAESMVRVARAELAMAESERRARRVTEQKALLDYRSLPELGDKWYINQNELDSARLTYEEVSRLLEEPHPDDAAEYGAVLPLLQAAPLLTATP